MPPEMFARWAYRHIVYSLKEADAKRCKIFSCPVAKLKLIKGKSQVVKTNSAWPPAAQKIRQFGNLPPMKGSEFRIGPIREEAARNSAPIAQ